MRIFFVLLSVAIFCSLLTGCTDNYVGTWQPIEVTMMGQTMEVPANERSEGSMTITKDGKNYKFTSKDSTSATGKKEGDMILFTEEGTGVKCELSTDATNPSHIKMRIKSEEMSQATSGLSATVITITYERVRN
ncbi:MAG: hypothetical protein ACYDCO_17520 [Armatimonadota bacterium]